MQTTIMFKQILEKVDTMPLEEQELIIEILKNRYREKRREEILKNAEKTLEEYRKGLASKGAVADLLKELEGQLPPAKAGSLCKTDSRL